MVEYTIYVLAENDFEAEMEAKNAIDHHETPDSVFPCEIDETRKIDPAWIDAIPHGDHDNDLTCKEWLEAHAPQPPPFVDPNQQKFSDFPTA